MYFDRNCVTMFSPRTEKMWVKESYFNKNGSPNYKFKEIQRKE